MIIKDEKGIGLVEAILALGLFAMVLASTVGIYLYGQESSYLAGKRQKALFLAEEGLEASRNMRDNSFTSLIVGSYGISASNTNWSFVASSDTDGFYTRQISITDIDSKRKAVTSTVSWIQNGQRSGTISLSEILTNWSAKSFGNWASSSLQSSYDLTLANSGNATANGISIAYANNYAYLGRVIGGGREFYVFDVSNPASPVLVGQVDLGGTLNDLVVVGNYVYGASTDDNGELTVINVSTPSAPSVAYNNLTVGNSGNNTADALSIASDGSYLYLGRITGGGREFYIYNLIDPANPALVSQINLAGNINDITVSGIYAYLATSDDSNELQIINTNIKTAPILAGSLNLNSGNNTADGLSIAYNNSGTVFLGRAANASSPEYYSINVSMANAPSLTGTLEIGANVSSIHYDSASNYSFLATAAATNAFKVVNNATLSAPVILGQLNVLVASSEVVYDPTLDRAFIASTADTQELQIIQPQ